VEGIGMSEREFVEVTLKLPKPITEWFQHSQKSLEKVLERVVVEHVYAEVDGVEPDLIMEKFGLKQIFKDYGLHVPRFELSRS